MKFDLFPKGKPMILFLGINALSSTRLHITVYDPQTERVYSERRLRLSGKGVVRLKLPITPEQLRVNVLSEHLKGAAPSFVLEAIKVTPDTVCPVELTEQDGDFIAFAKWFAVEVERLSAGKKGTIYQSNGFTILLLDTITENGMELTTPARIARQSGVIEISKKAVQDYTVPMLIVMLLHEYAHKYKNPEYGKDMQNELTADLIACHIALNLGFDLREVRNCFQAVFAKKDTDLNRRRMGAIDEFVDLFAQNESKRCKTRSHAS